MKTPSRFGLWLAPFAAALLLSFAVLLAPSFGTASLTGAALAAPGSGGGLLRVADEEGCAPGAPCPELIEVEVKDVVPLQEADAHAVVLVSKQEGTVLPIFVDEGSAVAIAFRLAHKEAPHPLAQDLMDRMVEALGGEVTEVRIDDVQDDVFTGRIFLDQGKRKLALDARPSDSIALALGRGAKIFVARKVLAQAGISQSEIDELRRGLSQRPHGLPGGPGLPPGHPQVPGGDQGPGLGGSGGAGDEPALPLPSPAGEQGSNPDEIRL